MKKVKLVIENNPKEAKRKFNKYPRYDITKASFMSDEEVETAQINWIRTVRTIAIRHTLIPVTLIFVLLLSAVTLFSLYLYNQQTNEIGSLNASVDQLSKDKKVLETRVSSLKENVENLDTENKNLKADNERLLDDVSEYTNKVSADIGHTVIIDNNRTSNSSDYIISNTSRTCSYPDCKNTASNSSYYCTRHECSQSGCHEKIANDYSSYCLLHKCGVTDCNSGVAYGGTYCYRHECIYPGCHKKKTTVSYCAEHSK